MGEVVTSVANPLVKRVRRLADRKYRRRDGAFVVEGLQPVWRAVEAAAEIETLIVAADLLRQPAAVRMVEEREAAGVPVARVSRELFLRLSDRDGPSGLAAIVRSGISAVEALPVGPAAVFVALHEVAGPGNLGTIIRTADAAGAAGVVLIGDTSDPFAPAAVKASMGSLFGVHLARVDSLDAFFDWAHGTGVTVVATSPSADDSHWAARYAPPLVVLLGGEGPGLPPQAIERSDLRVRIPMIGTAESLNLAVAAGLVLYEARRGALD
jgi:RNA methyltransferase, TrmH family